MTITSDPVFPEEGRKKIRLTQSVIDKMLQDETLRSLTGLLHTERTIDEIRAERLRKHDPIN